MKKSQIIFKLALSLLILSNLFSCLTLSFALGKKSALISQTLSNKETGSVQIKVLEESTLKPIDGATVCIVDTRHYENTNKHGKTNLIHVPIRQNPNFNLSLERPYGELTILVYKAGYADYLSFYNMIRPNTTNVGIVVKLKPIINEEDTDPIIDINYPDKLWCENLIKLYKKEL